MRRHDHKTRKHSTPTVARGSHLWSTPRAYGGEKEVMERMLQHRIEVAGLCTIQRHRTCFTELGVPFRAKPKLFIPADSNAADHHFHLYIHHPPPTTPFEVLFRFHSQNAASNFPPWTTQHSPTSYTSSTESLSVMDIPNPYLQDNNV